MWKSMKYIGLALILALAFALAACGDNNDNNNADGNNADNENNGEETEDNANNGNADDENASDDEGGDIELGGTDITIPYVAWAGSTTRTPILANVLEEVGYNVEVTQVEAGPMWTSTADDADTFNATGWLPATHGDYLDEYEGDAVVYEEDNLVDTAPLALTVPDYMVDEYGLEEMADLKDNDELIDDVGGEIIGIDPGAGIMQNTEEALEEYELDNWNLTSSSESAMLSELQEKVENEEPIVVPLWKPHWIFADIENLTMLDDPKDIYGGEGDQIQLIFNSEFEEEHPAAYEIATRFAADWGEDIENEYMEPIFVDDEDEEDVADQFMEENQDLVDEWTEGIAAE